MYDVVNDRPHLRVEPVLPAGPTVVDMMANSAFYYGTSRTLAEDERPLWTKMSFTRHMTNFLEAARSGMGGRLYWPGLGEVTPDEVGAGTLPPMADEGLRAGGGRRGSGSLPGRHRGPGQDRPQRFGVAGRHRPGSQEQGPPRPQALADAARYW